METIETTAHTGKKRKLDELISAGLPREFKSKGSWHRKGGKAQACRMDRAIQRLFNKKREIVNSGNFKLPHLDTLFTEAPWSIDVLQNMKSELNKTKSQLNDCSLFEWNFHTRQRNNAADVHWRLKQEVQPEFLTQAWYKFYENVSAFPLVSEKAVANSSLRSIHLCEAPGAFVTALNHWLRLNVPNITWNWVATTLNPHYEGNSLSRMINADCFIMHTLENWYFGADNTGNLMSLKNLDGLVRRAGTDVDLVTADGSIDCVDTPAEQELVVSHLHFCETIAALSLLQSGGSFLIKLFTIFEYQTICLVYLLSCCFDKIFINKPVTSKEGNSEVYLVCLGFAGSNLVAPYMETLRSNYESPCKTAMFRRDDIPESFIEQIVQCGEFFKARQCEVIMDNMKTFVGGKKYELQFKDKKMRRMVADEYIVRYNLSALDWEEQKIVGKNKMRLDESNVFDSITIRDSYNSRRDRENLKPEERLDIIVDNLNYIQPPPVENLTFKVSEMHIFFFLYVKTSSAGLLSHKCPQKTLRHFWKKIENLINVLKKRYVPFRKKIKICKMS